MATAYKVLGQLAPTADTDTALYTVPSATNTVVSTLAICNRGATTAYRVAVRPAGAALAVQHYLVYDGVIQQNDSVFLTIGITLGATDVLSVLADDATLSFSLFGSEIS